MSKGKKDAPQITPEQFHNLMKPLKVRHRPTTKSDLKISTKYKQGPKDIKESIVKDISSQLESWFTNGVDFTEGTSILTNAPFYNNDPESLNRILRQKHWLIGFQLLRQYKIPFMRWPYVLIVMPAYKKPESETKDFADKIRPILGINYILIPDPLVWKTKDMSPSPRSQKVATEWYNLTEKNWNEFILARLEEEDYLTYNLSITGVTEEENIHQILVDLGYDDFDIMQYCLHKQGFYYRDISDIFEEFGLVRSEEAVRKSFKRQEVKVKKC